MSWAEHPRPRYSIGMKKHFWLILAVLALLGMVIMPGMANSAVLSAPISLPGNSLTRIGLPNYPLGQLGSSQPRIQLPAPQLQASLVPVVQPSLSEAKLSVSVAAIPMVPVPVTIASPRSALPASKIAGISAVRQPSGSGQGARSVLARMSEGRLPSSVRITALFDGAARPERTPVVVQPVSEPEPEQFTASESEEPLTLPESDLMQEIGLGY